VQKAWHAIHGHHASPPLRRQPTGANYTRLRPSPQAPQQPHDFRSINPPSARPPPLLGSQPPPLTFRHPPAPSSDPVPAVPGTRHDEPSRIFSSQETPRALPEATMRRSHTNRAEHASSAPRALTRL
jgi:hypothetical protein